MTPKEKAKDLIDKFLGDESPIAWKYEAKTIALIAVDEIIKARPTTDGMIIGGTQTRPLTIHYWEEVKQEIEKL